MKSNAAIRIALYSIAIFLLLGILVVGLLNLLPRNRIQDEINYNNNNNYQTDQQTPGTEQGETVFPASIQDLEIHWAAGSVTIQTGDVEQITVSETKPADAEAMVCSVNKDQLIIRYSPKEEWISLGIHLTSASKDLVVTVPRDWQGGVLKLQCASAEIGIDGISGKELSVDTASGSCTVTGCTLEELEMDAASGSLFCDDSVVSSLDLDTASGGCTAVFTRLPREIDMDTASGDLELTFPEDAAFSVELDSVSGNLTTDFQTTADGKRICTGNFHSGGCTVQVDSVSGSVRIRRG